jgi:hypothetical protein
LRTISEATEDEVFKNIEDDCIIKGESKMRQQIEPLTEKQ